MQLADSSCQVEQRYARLNKSACQAIIDILIVCCLLRPGRLIAAVSRQNGAAAWFSCYLLLQTGAEQMEKWTTADVHPG